MRLQRTSQVYRLFRSSITKAFHSGHSRNGAGIPFRILKNTALRMPLDTIEKYKTLVFESAEFMASFVIWDEKRKQYVLGPPIVPAQEIYYRDLAWTRNPTFELAYWHYGLRVAQEWRKRLGLSRNRKWDHILEHLSPLPIRNGLYVATESHPDTFADAALRRDHPSLVAAFGVLPESAMIDCRVMRRTVREVIDTWDWDKTWGWNFPMVAMTAARLGEPEWAIEVLLMDKSQEPLCVQRALSTAGGTNRLPSSQWRFTDSSGNDGRRLGSFSQDILTWLPEKW